MARNDIQVVQCWVEREAGPIPDDIITGIDNLIADLERLQRIEQAARAYVRVWRDPESSQAEDDDTFEQLYAALGYESEASNA